MLLKMIEDIRTVFDRDPAARSLLEVLICYPGLHAVWSHRVNQIFWNLKLPTIARFLSQCTRFWTGIEIHPGATLGRRLFIDHGMGVVIGETTIIEEDVTIYQGVTLGALSFPRDRDGNLVRGQKRHPTLEDGVIVYANATILGGNTIIGHHTIVGSNVWLTHSVGPHTRVLLEGPTLKIRGKDEPGGLMYHI